MARCPGDAGLHARWTARSLAGAFVDLALVYAFLCIAAAASAASRFLALLGVPLPCTCSRPHLPCFLAFLSTYPSRALDSLRLALRSRFPLAISSPSDQEEEEEKEEEEFVDGDLRRMVVEEMGARAALQRELEKERSAAASAAEEAMAMILRLQKEKSALEIEARQQRRTADERFAFYEDEVGELQDIVLMREREVRALQKEVEAYRRLLGLVREDDEDDEMVTPHTFVLEGEPSSSSSADKNFGNESVHSFKTACLREELVSPIHVDHAKVVNDDMMVVQTPSKVPVIGSKMVLESYEHDSTETIEILPLSARNLDQSFDGDVDPTAGIEAVRGLPDEFQEVQCGGVGKIGHHHVGSENDANIYDVHVIDDICCPTEAKGLISRSFSDATIGVEKFQNRTTADDLLGKSLSAIKGAHDKIRLAANDKRQSLQLQLLEDIANQLQEIKDVAEAGRHLQCASPGHSKKC